MENKIDIVSKPEIILTMKSNYINIITADLGKLTEDQLYKVLVLVKNTVEDSKNTVEPVMAKPTLNRALFCGEPTDDTFLNFSVKLARKEILAKLFNLGFTGGYGILSFSAACSDKSSPEVSSYICFCEPNIFDCMIETFEVTDSSTIRHKLTIKRVGSVEINVNIFNIKDVLFTALENLKKLNTK